ncbi:MAG: thiamine diphosphokinase [bacterium]
MKHWALFVSGRYPAAHHDFYRRLAAGKRLVAVDGGYRFLKRLDMVPDLLIGDFDSLAGIPKGLPNSVEILRFPTAKDKTDTHLALDYCLKRGASKIDIVDPGCGEIDHLIGNVMLLTLGAGTSVSPPPRISIRSHRHEIRYVADGAMSFVDAVGDGLSIVPLSKKLVLDCLGVEYPARSLGLSRGDTNSLRNWITARRATVRVRGAALVIRLYHR